jgi:hypothetical protein
VASKSKKSWEKESHLHHFKSKSQLQKILELITTITFSPKGCNSNNPVKEEKEKGG